MPYNLTKTPEGLSIPVEWYDYTPAQLKEICNGCGPAGWKFDLVPDTIWGLSISEACDIHDFCYHIGETLEDKAEADKIFLNNVHTIIENNNGFALLKFLRKIRAKTYYRAVSKFGMDAFNT